MKKMQTIRLVLLLIFVAPCGIISAQVMRPSDFHSRYTLSEVVVFSRHNIRSPLSTKGSVTERITPHQWYSWTSEAGCLSMKGGVMESMMGQYFHQWLVGEGLFAENEILNEEEMRVYANSMQRTLATTHYFMSGFMPVANVQVESHCPLGTMDSIFTPQTTRLDDDFCRTAFRQIAEMNGERTQMHKLSPDVYYCVLNNTSNKLARNYSSICSVLDIKESQACLQGDTCRFVGSDTIWLKVNDEPRTTGTLKMACKASDALILQYYEERDDTKAAFNHDMSEVDWLRVSAVKDWYGDLLFTAPIVAKQIAEPLLNEIARELNTPGRKFAFLCGHDSNIGSILAALCVADYSLPHTIERKTPIGAKLVFEKWIDNNGKYYIAVNMVYHSSAQIRQGQYSPKGNEPVIVPIQFNGVSANADRLYPLDDFIKLLTNK